ncbi:hypothetical protein IQ260_19660 [Leptolyngbya cf. ectocarpi LEGE 11479]|uniref:Uncharacterized protein n=1 Tax=Leptolyngbya cf. ectocarpi LEGE 11479 TaxID=1828722 RepID=A0A928ZWV2_LEPEC|nr:hypothetical protein [Leptolyngbya ectocarpi]MBE9068865.1 hypothetical protein [Leptolyngbya cf. ectocarpi LEGE 11479]
MVLIAYARMSTRSRRAMTRATTRYGRPYQYRPRITLVRRLATELNMSLEDVLDQIQKERHYLLSRQT